MSLTVTQNNIIKQAVLLIEKQGLASFCFTKLANLTNYSKTTLYDSFANKEDVICGIFISNMDDIMKFNRALENTSNLTTKEKLLCLYMFEVIRAWCCKDASLKVNFIATNQYIWHHASKDTISHLAKCFRSRRIDRQNFWQQALDSGELQATTNSIRDISKTLLIIQRGAVVVAHNEMMQDNDNINNCEHIATEMERIFDRLSWTATQPYCDIKRALRVIYDYLGIDDIPNEKVTLDPLKIEMLEFS
ncbi:TetR/AcrR family transcriptional regulator [Shewanella youngdeokensis]|uniref:TetR/AcrR family transcriptional regulator n=1 Tax=Shewanella youngdeokensis TaxID=2999068 RepID=A0ABZ0JZ76_9GAMM|nr:TetR/AcrR family transcriptional regulator [Shewanella sp. DAU334]